MNNGLQELLRQAASRLLEKVKEIAGRRDALQLPKDLAVRRAGDGQRFPYPPSGPGDLEFFPVQ